MKCGKWLRQLDTYIELDVGIVSVVLVDLPVAGGNRQQFPFSIIHELPLIISNGLGAPPQSQVYFLHCRGRDNEGLKKDGRWKNNKVKQLKSTFYFNHVHHMKRLCVYMDFIQLFQFYLFLFYHSSLMVYLSNSKRHS